MITLTIKDALEQSPDTTGHYIYLYRDGGTVFYIGRSHSPLDRMMEHMALTGTSLGSIMGDLIKDYLPDSLAWTIELYTLPECAALTQKQYNPLIPSGLDDASEETLNRYLYDRYAGNIEDAMINHYKPCLNSTGVRHSNPLPDRYIKRKISNSGVHLG